MIRFMIETMTYIFGYIFQWRKINPAFLSPTKSVRVNLGCGLAVCPGWINVDASLNALFASMPLWFIKILYHLSGAHRYYTQDEYCRLLKDHIFIFHDLSRSLPFKENTIDYFFSSHFFEHLFLQDATRLIDDCYHSLKPGGIIRIAVPDLKHAIDLYHQGDKKKMLENYFFVNDLSSYLARHKYMYDFEILEKILKDIGFKNITQHSYQSGQVPDIDKLDNRPEETLFVEAEK